MQPQASSAHALYYLLLISPGQATDAHIQTSRLAQDKWQYRMQMSSGQHLCQGVPQSSAKLSATFMRTILF